jgi:DNA gyrase subunit A
MTRLLLAEPIPVRSTSGVKLLNLDTDDKVAAAVVIPPEDPKSQPENGTLLQ